MKASGREQFEGEALIGGEQFFEEPVALGDEQHAPRRFDGQDGVGDVVGGERVGGVEPRGEPAAGVGGGAGDGGEDLHGTRARGRASSGFTSSRRPSKDSSTFALAGVRAEVGDFEQHLAGLRAVQQRAGGEARDREVVARGADAARNRPCVLSSASFWRRRRGR